MSLISKMFEKTAARKTEKKVPEDEDPRMTAWYAGMEQINNGNFWSAMEEALFRWALWPASSLTPHNVMVYLNKHCGTDRGQAALEAMIGRMIFEAKDQGINTDPAYQDMKLIRKRVNRFQEAGQYVKES